jgi:hypothetical protein
MASKMESVQKVIPYSMELSTSFPAFCGTRRFIAAFTRALYLLLSTARPIQSTPTHPISPRLRNKSSENVLQFKYLVMTVTNQNLVQEKIKLRFNSVRPPLWSSGQSS